MPQRLSELHTIVLHHSASPRDSTTLEKITEWHMDPNRPGGAFRTVGYHYVIESNGALRYGRSLDEIPAAQAGANTGTIAVCIVGDNTKQGEEWTTAQLLSARSVVTMLRSLIRPRLRLCGHRDLTQTACPGVDVKEVFPDLVSV